ncbi:MAG: hypothetical protein HC896_03625 [Bacteroidales bacterium]|nr:hypothetical protein [Bacteroidales bacterium]
MAHPAATGGGGSSQVKPDTATSFLDGIKNYFAGKIEVNYAPGIVFIDHQEEQVYKSSKFLQALANRDWMPSILESPI